MGYRAHVGARTRASNDKASGSHLGSGSRSMRRLATIGLMERSDGCQMSFSRDGCPGVVRTGGAAGAVGAGAH